MGSRPAGRGGAVLRPVARHHAQRLLHGEHARSVEHAGFQCGRHHDGLLCRFGRHGHRLPHRAEGPRRGLLQSAAAGGPDAAISPQLVLRPFPKRRHAHRVQLLHRFSQGIPHAVVHPADQDHLQPEGCPQRILRLLLPAGLRLRPALHDHHGRAGLPLRLEVHVLLHDDPPARGPAHGGDLLPSRPSTAPDTAARAACPRNVRRLGRTADAHVRTLLRQGARLAVIAPHLPLRRARPRAARLFPPHAAPFPEPLRRSGAATPAPPRRC